VKSDELEKAFSALREETNGSEPRARTTLARVLVTTRRASRRRFRVLKLWLPIAAVLVASTAWAAASGHLDGLLTKSPVLAPTHQSALPAATEVEPSRVLYLAPSSVTAAPEPSATATISTLASAAEPEGPSPLARAKAAYEAAYRLHSKTNGDASAASAAVTAWDQYIARFPKGRFLPEARYARAVALARAGRQGEAKQAMEPFAKGDGYRKADAERWIQSLDANKK
jgi:TolA-binding protein